MSDYISREAAKEFFANMDAGNGHGYSTLLQPEEFAEYFDEFPTADVEPVRHGNWNIRLADEMTLCLECSVCGRKVDNIDLHYLLEAGEYGEACRRYPYCHCGAKMCLEGENNDD